MHEEFFRNELPAKIDGITGKEERRFGTMGLHEMIDHLKISLELTFGDMDVEFAIPRDKFEKARAFLHSEHPIRPGAQKPPVYEDAENAILSYAALDMQKADLKRRVEDFMRYLDENPNISHPHPNFGFLDRADWLAFQRKHFEHHLRQFGILPE